MANKSSTRNKNRSVVSNDALARLWIKNQNNSDFRFIQELEHLFSTGKAWMPRLAQIAQRLDISMHSAFFDSVYRHATSNAFSTKSVTGMDMQFGVEIFTISVAGNIQEIHSVFSEPSAIDALAKSMRATGWASKDSNVFLFPLLLTPLALEDTEPQDLWNISNVARLSITDIHTEEFWKKFTETTFQSIGRSVAKTPQISGSLKLGTRIFLGVRIAPLIEGAQAEPDGLSMSFDDLALDSLALSSQLAPNQTDNLDTEKLEEVYDTYMQKAFELEQEWSKHIDTLNFSEALSVQSPSSWQSLPFEIADILFSQSLYLSEVDSTRINTCWVWPDNANQACVCVVVDDDGKQVVFEMPFYLIMKTDKFWFDDQDFAVKNVSTKGELPLFDD